jgi:hypothetical protein
MNLTNAEKTARRKERYERRVATLANHAAYGGEARWNTLVEIERHLRNARQLMLWLEPGPTPETLQDALKDMDFELSLVFDGKPRPLY